MPLSHDELAEYIIAINPSDSVAIFRSGIPSRAVFERHRDTYYQFTSLCPHHYVDWESPEKQHISAWQIDDETIDRAWETRHTFGWNWGDFLHQIVTTWKGKSILYLPRVLTFVQQLNLKRGHINPIPIPPIDHFWMRLLRDGMDPNRTFDWLEYSRSLNSKRRPHYAIIGALADADLIMRYMPSNIVTPSTAHRLTRFVSTLAIESRPKWNWDWTRITFVDASIGFLLRYLPRIPHTQYTRICEEKNYSWSLVRNGVFDAKYLPVDFMRRCPVHDDPNTLSEIAKLPTFKSFAAANPSITELDCCLHDLEVNASAFDNPNLSNEFLSTYLNEHETAPLTERIILDLPALQRHNSYPIFTSFRYAPIKSNEIERGHPRPELRFFHVRFARAR